MVASFSRRGLFHTTALAGAVAVSLAATSAYGQQSQTRVYNIPAQSLAESLRAYGLESGEQIIFAERMVTGRQAPALQGAYNPDQALKILLADSGLTATRSETGGIMIRSASDPQSGSAAGDGADAGTVQALVVTAQKREENIQDVPIAMSAFTQEDLTRSQVAGGPDLMTQVPNFTFTKTNFTGYSIQIRGIGTQAISATTDAAVAVAENNTPFIRNRFFEQEFYDLERVEVLRGPQGTLYGRNATAGVVNIITAKPKFTYQAKLSADVGNY
ncbi:MAG: TonB-dependent receptor plug domain-containing protein, partial [Parcubacteria group bacterium]